MESGEEDGEDSGDEEILPNCQQSSIQSLQPDNSQGDVTNKSEKRLAEKRKEREDESNEEDDFITVNRRRPKRLIRSESSEAQNRRVDVEKNIELNNKHEVCITALENIPKQMALAKLLRSENIKNIIRIKYKSFNKVLIQFQEKEDATKLLDCIKFKEMGFRCQLINELSISYGVVKGVDLDLNEEEIKDILESSIEILNIKRLKRVNSEGKWVESESIRVGFKSKNLPQYIYAYDCRLKVESYVFPVTQCSGCWQFGHVMKYCPTKKKLCPKCGDNHENCDLNNVVCLNCKGDHLVIDKNCPMFLKEKEIRIIMSQEQLPYRRALQKVIEKRQKDNHTSNNISQNPIQLTNSSIGYESYSSIVTKNKTGSIRNENINFVEQSSQKDEIGMSQQDNTTRIAQSKRDRNRNTKSTKRPNDTEQPTEKEGESSQKEEGYRKRDEHLKYKFDFKKFMHKIKNLYMSEGTFADKGILFIKIIYEEIKEMLSSCCFLRGGFVEKIINLING